MQGNTVMVSGSDLATLPVQLYFAQRGALLLHTIDVSAATAVDTVHQLDFRLIFDRAVAEP